MFFIWKSSFFENTFPFQEPRKGGYSKGGFCGVECHFRNEGLSCVLLISYQQCLDNRASSPYIEKRLTPYRAILTKTAASVRKSVKQVFSGWVQKPLFQCPSDTRMPVIQVSSERPTIKGVSARHFFSGSPRAEYMQGSRSPMQVCL